MKTKKENRTGKRILVNLILWGQFGLIVFMAIGVIIRAITDFVLK